MKIIIVRDVDRNDITKGKTQKEYILNGNKIMPWYFNCESIEYFEGGLKFHVLEDIVIKKSYDAKNGDRLWILGKNKVASFEQLNSIGNLDGSEIRYEKIM